VERKRNLVRPKHGNIRRETEGGGGERGGDGRDEENDLRLIKFNVGRRQREGGK